MKTLTAKTGLILSILLVIAVLSYGLFSGKAANKDTDCTTSEKQNSSDVQSKLNLKGMTRHLLDFYK